MTKLRRNAGFCSTGEHDFGKKFDRVVSTSFSLTFRVSGKTVLRKRQDPKHPAILEERFAKLSVGHEVFSTGIVEVPAKLFSRQSGRLASLRTVHPASQGCGVKRYQRYAIGFHRSIVVGAKTKNLKTQFVVMIVMTLRQ